MKKNRILCVFLLIVLVMLGCAACGKEAPQETTAPTTAPTTEATEAPTEAQEEITVTFPENTTVVGTSVAGLTPAEATETLNSVLAAYYMEARVNGNYFTITAEDILLRIEESDMITYAQALEKGDTTVAAPIPQLDEGLLRQRIAAGTGSSVIDAKVTYNKTSQSFTITESRSGVSVDTYAAARVFVPAIQRLDASASATVEVHQTEPTIKSDDPRLIQARDRANQYLEISITYVYAPEGVESKSQTVTRNDIGGMILFDGSLNPYVSTTAVNNYAIAMNDKYCVRDTFETAGGSQLNVNVGTVLQAVDVQRLAADLKGCLERGISGTRTAPYGERIEPDENGYGSSYVEVDLTSQYLYVFKNGACVVSTPIVSGCVANGWHTPTGVYYIYAKSRNVSLVGPGYSSPVSYWMPFSGGYGLHDANWRSSFGGEIYLYDGSHGCVNIPPSVAGQVYDNVSVGTPVILYGGAASVKQRPQKLTALTSYEVNTSEKPFNLNVTGLGTPTFTYESSDPSVAQVSADGTVTVVAPGTAQITVTAPAHGSYLEGTLTITIKVLYDCGGEHNLTWSVTKQPTCAPGEETGVCACGYKETKPIAAIGEHDLGSWQETTSPTCAPGVESAKCIICNSTVTRPIDPIADHIYGPWEITEEPSCEAPGSKTCHCDFCGGSKTESIPATGHNFTFGNVCANGCGTVNPDAIVPEPPKDPEEPTDE